MLWFTARPIQRYSHGGSCSSSQGSGPGMGISRGGIGSSSSSIENGIQHVLEGHGQRARHEFRDMSCSGSLLAKHICTHTAAATAAAHATVVAVAAAAATCCNLTDVANTNSPRAHDPFTPHPPHTFQQEWLGSRDVVTLGTNCAHKEHHSAKYSLMNNKASRRIS